MAGQPGVIRRWVGFSMVGGAVVLGAVLVVKPPIAAPPAAHADPRLAACNTTRELDFAGAFNDCSAPVFDARIPCILPQPPHEYGFSVRLHGSRHDYLLYINIRGNYTGPQAYGLRPWPSAALGDQDGVPKVAVREFVSGDLWQSVEGLVRISADGSSGTLSATLTPPGGAQSGLSDMRVDGHWQCG